LPKKRKTKEADITPRVLAYFRDNYPYSVALEIKIKGNKPLPHQKVALAQVNAGTFSYKLPDMGKRNPFDAVVLKNAQGLLVTCDGYQCEVVRGDGSTFSIRI